MRRASRGVSPPPRALAVLVQGQTELERGRAHYSDPYDPKTGSFPFAVYKAAEVKGRLEDLFHGKCAYCETVYASSAPVDVEHFRPKAAVEGDDQHHGYWWLAMVWENLLPSCIDCNRRRRQVTPTGSASLQTLDENSRTLGSSAVLSSGKKDAFPIAGVRARSENDPLAGEQPLLLNPCDDDPEEHLLFYTEGTNPISLVLPRPDAAATPDPEAGDPAISQRGAVSIQVYGLNRLGLVQERTRVLRRLEFLEMLIIELGKLAEDLETGATGAIVPVAVKRLHFLQDQILAELRRMAAPQAPYSAMVKVWISQLRERLSAAP
ncbi:endonuclease [Hansschlegelia beijingensis]|uniref:Endonuclease n=1 Tax=Hansschlegelia beijingensis TaxID=1133344 RepID=A0A7W6GE60_9HYPH|nr:endonuclease [Hansschlegelia beijingensis]MBB3971855.1 hypothetical protein [Hansschlegelia beijingensis]